MLSVDHRTAVNPIAPIAPVDPVALERSISSATDALLEYRQADGHWVFELEADSTIPSEYVLLRHYLAEPVDSVLEAKIANYLRRTQGNHGGWPLVQDGPFAGYEAIFDGRISGRDRVRVLLNFLQKRQVPLDLREQQIGRVKRS